MGDTTESNTHGDMMPSPLRTKFKIILRLAVWAFITIISIVARRQFTGMPDVITQAELPVTEETKNQPIRVLITRTVALSEVAIVQEDVSYVQSFSLPGRSYNLLAKSTTYCDLLKDGDEKGLSQHDKDGYGSASFPNHILCSYSQAENNFLSVQADFMLFALSPEIGLQLKNHVSTMTNETHHLGFNATTTLGYNATTAPRPTHQVDVNIVDVSAQPKKLWNWLKYASEERLRGYDYVWFIDGDIRLTSLNWQAFFTQIRIMRPKISQAATIGHSFGSAGSTFKTLIHQADARIIAAETPIIELGAPLFQVDIWLKYRDFINSHPELVDSIAIGGENCFDMGWCHMAKNNMNGTQIRGKLWDYEIAYRNDSVTLLDGTNSSNGRSCIVFYQTPIFHDSKQSLGMDPNRRDGGIRMCDFLRGKYGISGKGGLHKVYELFNYVPKY
mmetsp:Transcript_1048/g.2074  ORF Transcript_1048/g.2074 Transcript_1048/m.2074 type:complete len:445 (-) Transcript_1048:50-1384(-)